MVCIDLSEEVDPQAATSANLLGQEWIFLRPGSLLVEDCMTRCGMSAYYVVRVASLSQANPVLRAGKSSDFLGLSAQTTPSYSFRCPRSAPRNGWVHSMLSMRKGSAFWQHVPVSLSVSASTVSLDVHLPSYKDKMLPP